LFKGGDGAVIGAKKVDGPVVQREIAHGDAGVVLKDDGAMGEEELAGGVEAAGMHEVGGCF
jgi:hypothetical protein